jgi:hypothetical protein
MTQANEEHVALPTTSNTLGILPLPYAVSNYDTLRGTYVHIVKLK